MMSTFYVASLAAGEGTFTKPKVVAPGSGYSDAPRLAVSHDGAHYLVYARSSGGPFDGYQVMYTRSVDGRNFDALRPISTRWPKGLERAAFPSFGIDADGRLYVVHELIRDYRERPRALGISISPDSGTTFTALALVPDSRDAVKERTAVIRNC